MGKKKFFIPSLPTFTQEIIFVYLVNFLTDNFVVDVFKLYLYFHYYKVFLFCFCITFQFSIMLRRLLNKFIEKSKN